LVQRDGFRRQSLPLGTVVLIWRVSFIWIYQSRFGMNRSHPTKCPIFYAHPVEWRLGRYPFSTQAQMIDTIGLSPVPGAFGENTMVRDGTGDLVDNAPGEG
jgi:hypothetical protein